MPNEAAAIANLLAEGYRVEVKNPHAVKFNEKYSVFQGPVPDLYRKIVMVNEHGEIRGLQG